MLKIKIAKQNQCSMQIVTALLKHLKKTQDAQTE